MGDAINLGLSSAHHEVVVGRIVRDVSTAVGLFDAADAVFEPGGARDRPGTSQRLGIALERPENLCAIGQRVIGPGGKVHVQIRQVFDVGKRPRLGTVGQVTIGQQEHWSAVLRGNAARFNRGIKAVDRATWCDNRNRCFTISAEHCLEQVRLFGLGGQSGGWSTALNVNDHKRQFHRHSKSDGFRLQCNARTRGCGDGQRPAKGCTKGGSDARDLVLGLKSHHTELLVLAQFVQDVAGWRDRVGTKVNRQARELASCDQAVGKSGVPSDVSVGSGIHRGRLDLVGNREILGGFTECVTSFEGRQVGRQNVRFLAKFLVQELNGSVGWAVIEPTQQT